MTLISQEKTMSYEEYALESARDMLRDLVDVFGMTSPEDRQQEAAQRYNINRVYAALGQLARIEL